MAKIGSGKRLLALVDEYIELTAAKDSRKAHFANVAGFSRFAGISVAKFFGLCEKFPEEFPVALAAFEDAALNSGATATLVGMYLKQYGLWQPPAEEEFVCDHDIFEDGI